MTSLPQQPPAYDHRPPYRSARTLAKLTIGALLLAMCGSIYELFVQLEGFGLVEDLLGGVEVPQATLDAYDIRAATVMLSSLAATGLCALVFCLWIFRASKNVQATGRPLRMSPGWAVGSFFVPILSLWRPYVAISNVWAMSDPDLGPDRPTTGGGLLITWWVLWLCSGFSDWGSGPDEVESMDAMKTQLFMSFVSAALTVTAGVLAIVIVHKLTRRQEVFAERFMVPPAQSIQR